MRSRILLVVCVGLLSSLAAPAAPPGQSGGQKEQPAKKKARKVWTNDDIPRLQQIRGVSVVGTTRPAPEAAPPAPKVKVEDTLWAELDKLREQRSLVASDLQLARGLQEKWEEERRRADDPGLREDLEATIEEKRQEIAALEAQLQEMDERIAALEEQTKGRKRPKPKPRAPVETPPAPQPSPSSQPPSR